MGTGLRFSHPKFVVLIAPLSSIMNQLLRNVEKKVKRPFVGMSLILEDCSKELGLALDFFL